ncbi:MAG TPA: signal recognition particle-docking protein FtsY, partial [bacterium]|nr:signal recognition particle-docking protein FtsY [bacterium]
MKLMNIVLVILLVTSLACSAKQKARSDEDSQPTPKEVKQEVAPPQEEAGDKVVEQKVEESITPPDAPVEETKPEVGAPSVVEAPVIEPPVVEKPIVEAPVVETPVVEKPVADIPMIEKPVAAEPD